MLIRMMAGKNFLGSGQTSITIKGMDPFKAVQNKLQQLGAKAAVQDPKSTKPIINYTLNNKEVELTLKNTGSEYHTQVKTNSSDLLGEICSDFPSEFFIK